MAKPLKLKDRKWFSWIVNNPKKVYLYSMIFLSVSYIGSLIQGIFFPSETNFKITTPVLYSKSQVVQNKSSHNGKEMEKIVKELETLKIKRDRKALEKKDSLRIDYLFNQYEKLKNGL
ncbi:hypothetical protein SD427_18810 (plasmid) [Chryseobacterium sp. JJR-5R]|uniref:hypothetical protein n=1 Tax=Chryseobacterium sp. JJR-5R TaxID=3093923 RepID=UPI002A75378A|nr:hypothetical protein [Chryseobacterium sp. JJR-5R]WPO84651.1 hypothetical protein SD427_18810 [Chryseobacterium sp. JJR-5R]